MSQGDVDATRAGLEAYNRGDVERWLETFPTQMSSSRLGSVYWKATTQGMKA